MSLYGNHTLLTAAEEIELARRIEAGRAAQQRIEAGDTSPCLTTQAAIGQAARARLILCNGRLVNAVVRRYHPHDPAITRPDLEQVGMIGLIRAVDRFNPHKGVRFSTHATWWILQAVSSAYRKAGIIRLPNHLYDDPQRAADAIEQTRGSILSLDAETAFDDGEGDPFGDCVAGGEDTERSALNNIMIEAVLEVPLTPNQRAALGDWLSGYSGAEMQGRRGISREMIRQTHLRLREKLRRRGWEVAV